MWYKYHYIIKDVNTSFTTVPSWILTWSWFVRLVVCSFNETLCVFMCVFVCVLQVSLVLVNPLWWTACSSLICIKTENCWMQRVSHQLITSCCVLQSSDLLMRQTFVKHLLDVFDLKSGSIRRWRSQSTRWTSRKRGSSWNWPLWTPLVLEMLWTKLSGECSLCTIRSS